MLTESFIASVSIEEKTLKNDWIFREAGIYNYEYQPLPALRSSFKRSSSKPNCLAVGASHIFAAQTDRAAVHVYNRDRGNQESIIPFPQKICSVVLFGDTNGGGVLGMGTEDGRITLWELCSGRQVSTLQSHLHATTCLVADPTFNFLLSGSPDSNIHVWSIPGLLSFSSLTNDDPNHLSPFSPQRTLSCHRAEITTLVVDHSSASTNIAISGSRDSTCIVWDYRSGDLLHIFLLTSAPLCLVLDPADRAFYIGYEDGSIQLVDFYTQISLNHSVHDLALQATPTQPPSASRWPIRAEVASAVLCISVSYDGLILISGHKNGTIYTWDVTTGQNGTPLAELLVPVTNIYLLSPIGFPNERIAALKLVNVVKPRYEISSGGNENDIGGGILPENYKMMAQLSSMLPLNCDSSKGAASDTLLADFDEAISHSSFPTHMLEEGIAVLSTLTDAYANKSINTSPNESQTIEIANLHVQLSQMRASKQAYTDKALELNAKVLMLYEERKTRETEKSRRKLKRDKVGEMKRREFMISGEANGSTASRENGGHRDEVPEESLNSSMDEMEVG